MEYIREKIALFIVSQIMDEKGEFHCANVPGWLGLDALEEYKGTVWSASVCVYIAGYKTTYSVATLSYDNYYVC